MKFFFKKYIASKKNIVLLIILAFIFFGLFVWNKVSINKEMYDTNVTVLNQEIQQDRIELNSAPKGRLTEIKNSMTHLEQQKSAWQAKNFNLFYQLNNENSLMILADYKSNRKSITGNIQQVKDSVIFYNKAKISGQNFSMTMGENDSGLGVFSYLSAWESSIVLLVIYSLICGDFLNNEFPNGLRFYKLARTEKKKLVNVYLLVPISLTFGISVTVFALFYIFTGVSSGFGSLNFPYQVNHGVIITAGQVMIWSVLYLLLTLIFITTLGQLLAILLKKPYLSSTVLVLIFICYSVLQSQNFMKPFFPWIPLSYLGSGQILSLGLNFGFGAIYVVTSSLIFYTLTQLLFSKYIYRKA